MTRLEMQLNIYILTQITTKRAAFLQAPFCPAHELTLMPPETVCLLLVPAGLSSLPLPSSCQQTGSYWFLPCCSVSVVGEH